MAIGAIFGLLSVIAGALAVHSLRSVLEAGALDSAGDIFFLTWDEAKRAAADPAEWVRTAAGSGREEFAR